MDSSITILDHLPPVDLRPVAGPAPHNLLDPVDPEAARLVPEFSAHRHGILPFAVTADAIHVAIGPHADDAGMRALAQLGRPVRLFKTSSTDLQTAQQRVWRSIIADEGLVQGAPLVAVRRLLGEILVADGTLSADDLVRALERQRATGGRLGEILVGSAALTALDVARALATQYDAPLIELQDDRDNAKLDPSLLDVMPSSFWHDHLLVPLRMRDGHLVVATADPTNEAALQQVRDAIGGPVQPVVTGTRDIAYALRRMYEREYVQESRLGLAARQPADSASYTLTRGQRYGLALAMLMAIGGSIVAPRVTVVGLNAAVQSFYLLLMVFYLGLTAVKLGLAGGATRVGGGIDVPAGDVAALDRASLPIYTVLVPAYREGNVLPILARALSALDYPHDRLDVKLLLEADDTETIVTARALQLPPFIDIVVVPVSEPRTKPKACNYGLQLARGEYVVIFDAEDIPEPDQLLKAVAAFRTVGPEVACLQAKLAYFNRGQNLLTRWFTAEYMMWFDLLLPALYAFRLPIPLGGTSNHFRRVVLRAIGAWDPYNVTEDADLGIRLHKAGYKTAVIDATTYEEANSDAGNWVRQRSRWLKGYMQTWLVHMRHPVALARSMGPVSFLGFQIIVGGTPITLLLNPVYAVLTTLWYMTHAGVLHALFPGWVYALAAANLCIGNFAFMYANMIAVARRGVWDLVAWTVLSPVYWTLMSIAAWKALAQLITRPSYWEKTEHGLSALPVDFATRQGVLS